MWYLDGDIYNTTITNNNNNNKIHPIKDHEGPQEVEELPYSFFNLGPRWRWMVNATPRPLYPQERDPVPTVQEAGWAPGPVWTGAENLVCHRDSFHGPSSP